MILTKKELNEWLKTAHNCGQMYGEYDSCGNYWSEEVFRKDNTYYAIFCHDGKPSRKFDEEKGYLDDTYELREVKMVERVEVITDWEYVD